MKIELPTNFPESPPVVKFIDPIDHVNVSPQTGELSMPMLGEEWSPYISLSNVIDLIDALLVEPETSPQYCVGSRVGVRVKQSVD